MAVGAETNVKWVDVSSSIFFQLHQGGAGETAHTPCPIYSTKGHDDSTRNILN